MTDKDTAGNSVLQVVLQVRLVRGGRGIERGRGGINITTPEASP